MAFTVKIHVEADDLADLRITEIEHGVAHVHLGPAGCLPPPWTTVTADDCARIAQAWRDAEVKILERQHGVGAVV